MAPRGLRSALSLRRRAASERAAHYAELGRLNASRSPIGREFDEQCCDTMCPRAKPETFAPVASWRSGAAAQPRSGATARAGIE